jgi:hypothetical protein
MPPFNVAATTALTAGQVMDRAAALMNDVDKTVYTYAAQLPYLNMAIDELQEILQENNMSPTNSTATFITVTAGVEKIVPVTDTTIPALPQYPYDLVEIRNLGERLSGNDEDAFVNMNRKDFLNVRVPTSSLIDWEWNNNEIRFYEGGATTDREIKLDYIRQAIQLAQNSVAVIGAIGARSYLSFKTASFAARFVGENPTRADELSGLADGALDRLLGIGAKGRQATYTRRRPFRSGYKARGWI